jgi:hypothetical protein
MPGVDLGVLRDMPAIRDKASAKLAHKEVATLLSGTQPVLFSKHVPWTGVISLLVSSFSCLLIASGAMLRDASVNLQGDGNACAKALLIHFLLDKVP